MPSNADWKQAATCYLAFSLADAQAGRASINKAAWKRQPFRQLPSPIIQSEFVTEQAPATDFNPQSDDPKTLTLADLKDWETPKGFVALIWHPIVYRRTENIRHGMQTHQWAPDYLTPVSVLIYADCNGNLITHGRPRFSRECLEPAGFGSITLGNVDQADSFYEANQFPEWDIPGAVDSETRERWPLSEVSKYSEALFNKVCEIDPKNPIPGVRYDRISYGVVLPAGQPDIATKSLLSTYDAIETLAPKIPLFARLISPITEEDNDQPRIAESLPRTCGRWGTLQSNRQLSDDQERALNACLNLKDAEIQAVNGPPGTGKTALLQDLIASEVVKAALQGKPAPAIVISSTNNQAITNALTSMALPDDDRHNSGNAWLEESRRNLTQRWIPFWSSLGLYDASISAQESAKERGYLVGDDMDRFESTADLTEFTMTFIRKTRSLTGDSSIASMDEATKALSRRLKAEAGQQLFLQTLPQRLRKSNNANRLAEWVSKLNEELSKWPALGFGFGEVEQKAVNDVSRQATGIIDQMKELENCLKEAKRCDEVVKSVVDNDGPTRALLRWQHLSFVKGIVKARRKQLSNRNGDDLDELVNRAIRHTELGKALRKQINNNFRVLVSDSVQQGLIPLLDKHLHMHGRNRWFWLAIHLREGEWLQSMGERGQGGRDKRSEEGAKAQIQRRSLLAPVSICTLHRLPKAYSYWDAGKQAELPLFGHIDLLIIDEGGQCAPDVAAPAFALSKKAVVMGDVAQLQPVWSIESREDTGNRIASGLISRNDVISIKNDRISRSGISTSEGNILSLCQKVSAFESKTDQSRGLWLTEHRRCVPEIFEFCNNLSYDGRIKSSRNSESLSPLHPVNFMDIPGTDERSGGSRVNDLESAVIASWVAENVSTLEAVYKRPVSEITAIIAPFKAQAQSIDKMLTGIMGNGHNITVGTVHATQGAQYPIVLLSITYGAQPVGRRLFFDENESMLNVAVSRAMDSLIVVGDLDVLNQGGRPSRLLGKHCEKFGYRLSWPDLEAATTKMDGEIVLRGIRKVFGSDALIKKVPEDQPSALTMALTDESIQTVVVLADNIDKAAIQSFGNESIRAARRGVQVLWVVSHAAITSSPDETVLLSAVDKLKSHGVDVRFVGSVFSNAIILPDQNLAFRSDRSWVTSTGPVQSIVIQSQSRQEWDRIVNLFQIKSQSSAQSLSA
jgi:hypothetical protein